MDKLRETKLKMGNVSKYSKALADKICKLIASGLNNKQACAASGVSETSFMQYRKQHPDFATRVEAAREIMRSKILAKIKAAGKDDWRALECFLRLSFAEYRFSNSQQVNVAVQQNMSVYNPERAELIDKLEKARAAALADNSVATDPKDLESGASDAREIAEKAERELAKQNAKPAIIIPEPKKQMTIIDRHDEQLRRMKNEGWRAATDADEILDY